MSALLLALALAAAPPSDVVQERKAVQGQLQSQKTALSLLQSQKISALAVLDLYDRLTHDYLNRAHWLQTRVEGLEKLRAHVAFEQALSQRAVEEKVAQVGPRLLVQYRLSRRRTLDVLLPAKDLAALVWRARSLSALTREDLEDLEELQRLSRFTDSLASELGGLDRQLDESRQEAKLQADHARSMRDELTDAVAYLGAKAHESERIITDLQRADEELAKTIHDLTQGPATSGFGALRGKLVSPVEGGHIEVGYGNVLNSKFNTVTLHKGFDIRVAQGTPVKAIAPGKVAWANWMRGYGNLLIVDHGDGYFTLMAHLARFERQVGEAVKPGDVLGEVGDTGSLKGAFLYFELREKGQAVDPAPWFK
jgi:murein DD-endopeptidase MepM/ murein hydrolase activator NlpD